MNTDDLDSHRAALFGVAYRMLGSVADADDVVQEALIRYASADRADVDSPRAFLTTMTTRLCLDKLRAVKARRETYVGPWLPEPLVGADLTASAPDVESISIAFLVVLESLSPLERAAFLLHEVFDYSHAEVARALERDEAASRKLVERARAHLRERRPRFTSSKEAHERVVRSFVSALASGELAGLEAVLTEGVVARADGGGHVHAARRPVVGRAEVARYLRGLLRGKQEGDVFELVHVNGTLGLRGVRAGKTLLVIAVESDGHAVSSLSLMANPEKLTHAS